MGTAARVIVVADMVAPGHYEGRSGGALLAQASALLALSLAPGCGQDSPARPNVLLVVVDTLRRDHLGCYGYERPTSPTIDALAERSVRFDNAYTTAPWTSPAIASILTSLYPSAHNVVRGGAILPEKLTTLTETLSAHGYATGGVTSNWQTRKGSGFDQGFELYSDSQVKGTKHVSSPDVTSEALTMLDQLMVGGHPFFLSVLYFDPHCAYMRHPEYGFAAPPAGRIRGGEDMLELRSMMATMSALEVQCLRDLYDEEIAFTDASFGRLLEGLDARGLAENTLILFMSDHGEEFLAHGWLGHTRNLYQDMVRVPLIVHDPRTDSRGRVEPTRVSLVSIAPTVLDLVGLDPLELGYSAPSLRPLLEGRSAGDAWPIYCEVDFIPVNAKHGNKRSRKRSILVGRHKLIRDDATDRFELYDVERDPLETEDLAASSPELVRELERALDRMSDRAARGAVATQQPVLSEKDIEVLRGLGYADR